MEKGYIGKTGCIPPPVGCLKLNTDSFVRRCTELGEFLASRVGLSLVKELGFTVSLAEVDATNVVTGINNVKTFNGVVAFVINDIQCLSSAQGCWDSEVFFHTRLGNAMTHNLALMGFSS
ncbi:hypothetical protein ACOSQ3_000876 [Xanthoceras sorbifolium]